MDAAGVESRRGQSGPAAVFLRRCPAASSGRARAVCSAPQMPAACRMRRPPWQPAHFRWSQGKAGCGARRAVTPAWRMRGCRRSEAEVDHEQDERGQDQATMPLRGEGDDKMASRSQGYGALHDPTISGDSGEMPGPLRLVLSHPVGQTLHAVPSCGTLVSSSPGAPVNLDGRPGRAPTWPAPCSVARSR